MKQRFNKEYYNLKELQNLSGLKYRQLNNRVKEIQNNYSENDSRIFKESNQWQIHKSLIEEFNRKRKSDLKYKYMITINPSPENNYNNEGWRSIIHQLHCKFKEIDSEAVTRYSIEQTQYFMNHVHLLTTVSNKTALTKILYSDFYLKDGNITNIHIEEIWDEQGALGYIQKLVRSEILS